MTLDEIIAQARAEVRGEVQGPITLNHMISLFYEYRRAVKLAEYNLSGRNPRNPRDKLKFGERLQARADRLAQNFPSFPKALQGMEK